VKNILLSETSLATAAYAPTIMLQAPAAMATSGTWLTVSPRSRALLTASVASLLAAVPMAAESAVIYSVNGVNIASGGTLYIPFGNNATPTASSSAVGFTLIGSTAVGQTFSNTITLLNTAPDGKNIFVSATPIVGTGFTATSNQYGTMNPGNAGTLVNTFTFTPNTALIRGFSQAATFQILASGGKDSGFPTASDTTNITLMSNWVAPVQSTAATATLQSGGKNFVYALPGQKASGTVTITNIGDGNLAGADNGTTLLSNLRGTVTTSAGAGFTIAPSGPTTFSLTDNSVTPNQITTTTTTSVTYAGTTRGASGTATVTASFTNGSTANNNAGGQTATYTFTGQTVAPVASLSSNTAEVRVGTSGSVALTVTNTGDGNLAGKTPGFNLTGSVASSTGTFTGTGGSLNGATGLNDSTFGAGAVTSQTYSFTYAPTARGTDSTTVAVSLDNGTNTANAGGTLGPTLAAKAVGPVYESKFTTNGATTTTTGTGANQNEVFGGTILFGDIVGGLTNQNLLISNITNDLGQSNLTTLSLTSITITGNTEYSFSLSGFNSNTATSATVKSADNGRIAGTVAIQFNQLANNFAGGQLRIQTDEGVAFNNPNGTVYVYNLQWTVPEPGTIMVFGTALLGFAISRRRRHGHGNEAVSLTARDEEHPTKG
jgi:hypothetical protein